MATAVVRRDSETGKLIDQVVLPSEEGTPYNGLRSFTRKPRPESAKARIWPCLLLGSQGQNLAVTVAYMPSDRGVGWLRRLFEEIPRRES